MTDPVVTEVASGARTDERESALRRLMARFEFLPFDPVADLDGAVRIYRTCRKAGVTPRGLIDCMIASVAMRNDVAILAHHTDVARIADVMPLELDAASLRPA